MATQSRHAFATFVNAVYCCWVRWCVVLNGGSHTSISSGDHGALLAVPWIATRQHHVASTSHLRIDFRTAALIDGAASKHGRLSYYNR